MTRTIAVAIWAVAMLAGCTPSADEDLWDCQFSVQKGNAGKDAAAAAERTRDIEACMEQRGFRLAGSSGCLNGSTDPACYQRK